MIKQRGDHCGIAGDSIPNSGGRGRVPRVHLHFQTVLAYIDLDNSSYRYQTLSAGPGIWSLDTCLLNCDEHLSICHLSIRSSIYPLVCPSIHLSDHPSTHLSVCLSVLLLCLLELHSPVLPLTLGKHRVNCSLKIMRPWWPQLCDTLPSTSQTSNSCFMSLPGQGRN